MKRLRIVLLAPDCNPESVTTPQIAYAHAAALANLHDVTLVVREANLEACRRGGAGFRSIEPVRLPGVDELYRWAIRRVFKYDYGRQSLTAATYPLQVAFEWRAWQLLKLRIRSGEFDVVLRILPIVAVLPSPFAFLLRKGPIPFVLGPLNGGLPWPTGFPQLDMQRREAGYWVAHLRNLYRRLPFAKSTYNDAAAIIAGSSHTYAEFARFSDKLFFVTGENGVDPTRFAGLARQPASAASILRLIFVGRLIPLKACDLALRASADLLRTGRAQFTIVGDGPDRARLENLARELGVDHAVTFTGWVTPDAALARFASADVLVFPSLREFGGAVIFEALGMGAVPVVADFGGPGDIVVDEVGYRIALTNEEQFLRRLTEVLSRLASDPQHLEVLRRRGMDYARNQLTWEGKAKSVSQVLEWVVGSGPKPVLLPPAARRDAETDLSAAPRSRPVGQLQEER